jgi:hypothetical protein
VEQQLRAIGQTFASVGAPDPQVNPFGDIDFRLYRQLHGYKKQDPPPCRVKPLPIKVLHRLAFIAFAMAGAGAVEALAIYHMIVIAFFFLLRPGEYTSPSPETACFRLCDVGLFVGDAKHAGHTIPMQLLDLSHFGTLCFTDQKNGIGGEVIGHGLSGDPYLCPVTSIKARVRHLREHDAPPETPLCCFYRGNQQHSVTASAITTTLKAMVTQLGPATLGFLATDVSPRSLRAAGAMALFCARVDSDTIKLIGRWRSDEMLRYLHVQAAPLMQGFARCPPHARRRPVRIAPQCGCSKRTGRPLEPASSLHLLRPPPFSLWLPVWQL